MSRSTNGKRSRMPKVKEALASILEAVKSRHVFGSTEKILRRNRKLWTRLGAKRRRAHDRAEIARAVNE